jgi:plasmid stabilization system protein ParE
MLCSNYLGRMPRMGHKRRQLTHLPVLFFPICSYTIAYWPDKDPIQIIAVVRDKRDVRRILGERH